MIPSSFFHTPDRKYDVFSEPPDTLICVSDDSALRPAMACS